ncbi:MAG TPA: S41 family peptidase [Chitinophagales bacterium]|nr:S41 family peptidase [Chitinophagales bacterium]
MTNIKHLLTLLLLTVTISAFSQTTSTPAPEKELTQEEALEKFERFLSIVDDRYMDDVNAGKLVEDAIIEVLLQLDPHSVYFTPEELEEANEPLEGNFEGVGIQFNLLRDTIIVVSVISGGPSEKVGILAGDKIVQINEEPVAGIGMTNKGVTDRLRGKKGTNVNVFVERKGAKKVLEFKITRDVIPLYSIDAKYMADPATGYIRVSKFAATTTEEFQQAIKELKAKGMQNLILDLRGNGGGYLNAAIDMANEFLPANKLIVYTEGRAYPRQDAFSRGTGMLQDGKIIVLIDEGSASASEIVTGALQDWDRALVIGRRSFGKGLVQRSFNLTDGSAMRLTVSRYYTPSGRCIQKSYANGIDAYHNELNDRYVDGELTADTTFHYPDSLTFYTSNKRTVYGGGGIMPDIYIPLDTSWATDYYAEVVGKGIVNQFALTYVNENREMLTKQYADAFAFRDKFEVDTKLWDTFFAYAEKDSVKKDDTDFHKCEAQLANVLKSVIARDLYNFEAYWIVSNSDDKAYLRALEALKDDTFQKMHIAGK